MDAFKRQQSRAIVYDVRGVDDELARIEMLTEAVRAGGDTGAETELIRLRYQVWRSGRYPDPPQHWPPTSSVRDFGGTEIPMVAPDELTAQVLHSAMRNKSCLLVRGLMPEQNADELVAGTDRALDAYQRRQAGETDPALASWFHPFVPEGGQDDHAVSRRWAAALGTIYAAESPRNFSRLIDICNSMGILDLLTDYFGVRPVLSTQRTAFKRVAPNAPGGWHQDGLAFGKETRALNMWVALSSCGTLAPGLALVPLNPGGMVEDISPPPGLTPISDATINRLVAEGTPVREPVFEKGDVLFFDTLLPHQTQQGGKFTQTRYALECWFFTPTTVAEFWCPLHV